MECFTNPAGLLLSAYKERNILPDLDQIYSAFPEYNDDKGGNRNASWVSNHLKYDTLLSREELTLYVYTSYTPGKYSQLKILTGSPS